MSAFVWDWDVSRIDMGVRTDALMTDVQMYRFESLTDADSLVKQTALSHAYVNVFPLDNADADAVADAGAYASEIERQSARALADSDELE